MHWHVSESYRAAHKTGYTTSIEGTAISHLGAIFKAKREVQAVWQRQKQNNFLMLSAYFY